MLAFVQSLRREGVFLAIGSSTVVSGSNAILAEVVDIFNGQEMKGFSVRSAAGYVQVQDALKNE